MDKLVGEKSKKAQIQELSKIERIKKAAIEVISKNGFSNTSVADIAKEADVSVGYLYRHYEGKQQLVNNIITDMYKSVLHSTMNILEKSHTTEEVCTRVIKYHYNIYKQSPEKIKFLVMLINDFGINTYSEHKIYITEICQLFYADFIKKEGVRKEITKDEVYIALVVIPLQSLALRLRGIILTNSKEEDVINTIKKISLKIVE